MFDLGRAPVLFACGVLALSCASRNRPPPARVSALELTSAPVGANTLSCRAEAFCREDAVVVPTADATEELSEACARYGGTTSRGPCAREHVVAACSVSSGEFGPTVVLTYAQASADREQAAIETMTDLCEQFDGALTLVRRR